MAPPIRAARGLRSAISRLAAQPLICSVARRRPTFVRGERPFDKRAVGVRQRRRIRQRRRFSRQPLLDIGARLRPIGIDERKPSYVAVSIFCHHATAEDAFESESQTQSRGARGRVGGVAFPIRRGDCRTQKRRPSAKNFRLCWRAFFGAQRHARYGRFRCCARRAESANNSSCPPESESTNPNRGASRRKTADRRFAATHDNRRAFARARRTARKAKNPKPIRAARRRARRRKVGRSENRRAGRETIRRRNPIRAEREKAARRPQPGRS